MQATDPAGTPLFRPAIWWRLALALVLIAYFAWFNWPTLRVHFALDGFTNIGHYHEYSNWQLVLSNFIPWRGDLRPLGAAFYIPIYHFAGLDPMPYQAGLLVLLLCNVYWAYRFAKLLGAGEVAAWLVALAACYHGGMANLYYNAAFVFDVMACFFFLATFVYYLRIRNQGRLLKPGEMIVLVALVLCAVNSKEMSVAIPPMLLIYEWVYHPPKWNAAGIKAWIRGPLLPAWLASIPALLCIYGKVAPANALMKAERYRPQFTFDRFHEFQVNLFQDSFFSWRWIPGWGQIVGTWMLLAYLAWRRPDRPILRFLFWFLVIVSLPIEFIPGRREACFVLLMIAGGIFLAVVFLDAVHSASQWVSREFKLPRVGYYALSVIMIGAAVIVWVEDQIDLRHNFVTGPEATLGWEEWDLIDQLRHIPFHPRPNSSIAVLDDPLHNLDMFFMIRMWVHDGSVQVHVFDQGPLSPVELAKRDYVFTWENRKLVRIR